MMISKKKKIENDNIRKLTVRETDNDLSLIENESSNNGKIWQSKKSCL